MPKMGTNHHMHAHTQYMKGTEHINHIILIDARGSCTLAIYCVTLILGIIPSTNTVKVENSYSSKISSLLIQFFFHNHVVTVLQKNSSSKITFYHIAGYTGSNYRIEGHVASALKRLATKCGTSRAQMVDVLKYNPGNIHSFCNFNYRHGLRFQGCKLTLPRCSCMSKFREYWCKKLG